MRRAARVDSNQPALVKELRQLGASVAVTSYLGDGFPDLVLGWRGGNFLFEVKDGSKPSSQRRLTEREQIFHDTWNGQINIVTDVEEIVAIVQRAW